jgi:hypothetical protein
LWGSSLLPLFVCRRKIFRGLSLSVIKQVKHFALLLAVSFCALWLLSAAGFFRYIDTALYDLTVKSRVQDGGQNRNLLVATIDLNDASIAALGAALDTRLAFADALEVLADSGSLAVMDFLFLHEKSEVSAFVRPLNWVGDTVVATLAVPADMLALPNTPYRPLTAAEEAPYFAFPTALLFFLWAGAFLHRLFARYQKQLLLHNALLW